MIAKLRVNPPIVRARIAQDRRSHPKPATLEKCESYISCVEIDSTSRMEPTMTSIEKNTEYTKLASPTLAQQYTLRTRTAARHVRVVGRTRIVIEEKIATHGCQSDGTRRWFEAVIQTGTMDGGFGKSVVSEGIGYDETLDGVLAKATAWLGARKEVRA